MCFHYLFLLGLVTSTIWLPTEWHHPCVRTPVEQDGLVGFKQSCISTAHLVFSAVRIFFKMPHKTDMSTQRVILNYNNDHCVTAIPWVNLHKPTRPVKNWRTWCKVLLPHAPADGNQRIITIILLLLLLQPFNGLFSRTTWVSRYQIGKTNLDLLEQETVSGSGISSAVCKSAPRSRQITTPVPHHSVFYRPDALPAAQPTASKH